MPQMMPINWILSFLMFILIFIMFNIMNYYIMNNKNLNNKNNFKLKSMNNLTWKW
uniref:ATP synthase complex subunit 8 n=1 Tax=Apocheima cinerarius TaxID=706528 RepID=A0A075D7U0_APOCI|nr:ATP synthase F0 subunit 8 [Apocheima cinerarius]AHG99140.1 ATP synthase F0 subunit 8 [Apocheima cinerarius]ALI31057.1 ATP synthase F0 subunit 8 [Apocheima cinerarius]ALO20592.1 ATP synthase F0 subunit 8 [Apocheima cinerarius]ALO20600.1 ATP synthase F0 subunit 8 [Apocheima cinerarius]ALP86122.1 ATP synthase F0 subunit 8 [Apocheima cinerarius]